MRKFALTSTLAVALAMIFQSAPAGAGIFTYYRHGTLINGQIRGECGYQCVTSWYRAGSGSGTNACATNNWIPVGGYNVTYHQDNFAGSKIQGRVWKISDYQCSNGVLRWDLFVHSEETSSNGQSCPTGNDDPFCWEGANDYYSNGCIKVARIPVTNGLSDLGRVDNFQHGLNGPVTQVWVYA